MKQNSTNGLSVEIVTAALSGMKTCFGSMDASAQASKTTKQRCMLSAIARLNNDVLIPLLAQVIAFSAAELLDDSGNIPCIDFNAAQYQPVRCKV